MKPKSNPLRKRRIRRRDPRDVLREIASDPQAPATARVAAAKALILVGDPPPKPPAKTSGRPDDTDLDQITRRALDMIARPSTARLQ